MTDRRLTDAHMRTSFDRQERVGAYVTRLGRQLGYGSDEFVESAVDVVLAGQAEQVEATWSYLSTAAELADPLERAVDLAPPTDKLIGAATHDGTPLETVYRRPAALEERLADEGLSPAEIAAQVDAEARLTASADVATAGRHSEQAYGAVDKRIVGWRRVPDANACQWCQWIATQRYTTSDLAPAHRGCHCGTEPILSNNVADPGQIVDRDAYERIKREGIPKRYGQRTRDAKKANRSIERFGELPEITESPAARGIPKRAKLAADSPEIVEIADRYQVAPDEVLAGRARLKDVRQSIRDDAARVQLEAFEQLDDWNARTIARPPRDRTGLGEWDWLDSLDARERGRLSRQFYSDTGVGPDVIAEQMRAVGAIPFDASTDDAMKLWLDATRRYEAAGAVRRGKLPSSRAYSGDIDVDDLIGSVSDEGYSVTKILGSDDLDAAGHIVSVEKDLLVEEAKDYLGHAYNATEGPSPYRMSYQAWHDEVRELEYGLREFPGEMAANAKTRYAELVPEFLDEPGLGFEDLYARIVDTAYRAGEEVPDHVGIPWQ